MPLVIGKDDLMRIREKYPIGCRVELVKMDDLQAPPKGTQGTVSWVDDIGTVFVDWDNGGSLGAINGEDIIRRIS